MAMRPVKRTLRERLAKPDEWPGWPLLHVQRETSTVPGLTRDLLVEDGTIHARMGFFRVILVHPDKTGIKNLDEFPYEDYPTFEDLEAAGWHTTD